ncbi:MAG: hypothetical protein ABSG41_17080 [Bryobacteraceae bacterium]
MRGARGALEPLFEAQAPDFRMAWIFIDMMPADGLDSAATSAGRVTDSRLAPFHDPKHVAGRAMARCLGWKGHVAWDTYFVYRTGSLWTGVEMPYPDAWFHQLKDREVWEQTAEADLGTAEWTHALAEKSEADPAHFRTGDDLRVALGNALKEAAAAQPITASSASGS